MNINNKLKLYCKICQRFFRDKDALKCHLNSSRLYVKSLDEDY